MSRARDHQCTAPKNDNGCELNRHYFHKGQGDLSLTLSAVTPDPYISHLLIFTLRQIWRCIAHRLQVKYAYKYKVGKWACTYSSDPHVDQTDRICQRQRGSGSNSCAPFRCTMWWRRDVTDSANVLWSTGAKELTPGGRRRIRTQSTHHGYTAARWGRTPEKSLSGLWYSDMNVVFSFSVLCSTEGSFMRVSRALNLIDTWSNVCPHILSQNDFKYAATEA